MEDISRLKFFFLSIRTFAALWFGFALSSQAQSDSTNAVCEFSLHEHVGRLVKIHGEYPDFGISSITEFYACRKLNGKKKWHSTYGYPTAGISILHAQFGNQDVLGQAVGIIPSMRFEKWKSNTRWSWRAGLGVAGFNKPYDAETNPRNLVIGSKMTNMTMFRIEMSRPLTSKIRYAVGASFTHCSDAHIAVPNIGANLISFHAGLSFCNHPELLMHNTKTKQRIHESWRPGIEMIGGMHEFPGTVRPINGPTYFVYGQSVYFGRSYSAFRKLTFGFNHYYYTAYYDYMKSQELFPHDSNLKTKANNVVAFAGYEWSYGKMSLFLQAGLSLYHPFLKAMNEVWDLPKHGLLYSYTSNKIGYRYHFLTNESGKNHALLPYVHIAVKTNGGTADFLELAMGVAFHGSK